MSRSRKANNDGNFPIKNIHIAYGVEHIKIDTLGPGKTEKIQKLEQKSENPHR